MVLTETEQDILFKVITGDDIGDEEVQIIAASSQLGHCELELELKRKIVEGEDFTREDVRIARDLIRERSIVRDLEIIRSNLERRVWSARSRFILEKNVAAYQNRTRRTISRRDERCSLDFRGHELFFRVVASAHGVARARRRARAVCILSRRELFSLTPNRDLVPALFIARMLNCPEVDIAQCMFDEGFTSVKISTFVVERYQNLMDVVVSRLFQVVALVVELRKDHDLRACFVRMDPLEKISSCTSACSGYRPTHYFRFLENALPRRSPDRRPRSHRTASRALRRHSRLYALEAFASLCFPRPTSV